MRRENCECPRIFCARSRVNAELKYDLEEDMRVRVVGHREWPVLAGKWNPSLWTRFLNHLFFGLVWIQKRFNVTRLNFRRDRNAGYPTETRSKELSGA